jgi:hypothetical protein
MSMIGKTLIMDEGWRIHPMNQAGLRHTSAREEAMALKPDTQPGLKVSAL